MALPNDRNSREYQSFTLDSMGQAALNLKIIAGGVGTLPGALNDRWYQAFTLDGSGNPAFNAVLAAGSSVITGSGTAGKIAKFTSASAIGDSIITESGATATVNNTLVAPRVLTSTTAAGSRYPSYVVGASQWFMGNAWSPTVTDDQFWDLDVVGLNLIPVITAPTWGAPHSSLTMVGAFIGPQYSTFTAGSHIVQGLSANSTPITLNGTATLAAVSALYVEQAYSYTTTPIAGQVYSLWSASGNNRLDGKTAFGGIVLPTALTHLAAGTTAATTAPLKFTSGSLLTTAEVGAIEFLTDAYYGTITTGAARKTFAFLESPSFTTPNIGVASGTRLTLSGAANASAFVETGYSLTGSNTSPLVSMTGTWNTSGAPILLDFDITQTAASASSYFLKFRDGATDYFTIALDGAVAIRANATLTAAGVTGTGNLSLNPANNGTVVTGGLYNGTSGTNGNQRYTPNFAPTSGNLAFAGVEYRPTINATGTVSGAAVTVFAIAPILTSITGTTVYLADFGTTTTSYFSGFTSKYRIQTDGSVTQAGVAFASLGTPGVGTRVYCTNCDPPAAGIMAVCTSAGTQTGAWAFRVNSGAAVWGCIGL